jgi:RNA polymerase sigma-70 factor, ECF subfamily
MATSKQEAQLVLRAQCHDREALESLLRGVMPALRRYLLGLVGTLEGDDVLQDVLVLVCRNLSCLQTPELFRPWTYKIASRAAFRRLKQEKNRLEHALDESVLEQLSAPDARPPAEFFDDLLDTSAIPAASRAVLALHFREDLSLPEVAAILEIPLGTVKSRLAYGLAALRKQLNQTRSI